MERIDRGRLTRSFSHAWLSVDAVLRCYRRPSTNACQAGALTVTIGPDGALLSRTGTDPAEQSSATSTHSPPLLPL
jgi:hypothetical protein